jgi:serine/threonine protein kinase/WD40 repeat protein
VSQSRSIDLDRVTQSTLDSLAGASVEEAESLTGEVLGGILEVGQLLGKGGMGIVYQVFHREWNRQLAMKVPLAIGDQEGFDLKRWVREAHTWIDLGLHPRVVSCWFVRQWKGVPILFLDLFSGGSLKEKLEQRSGPPQTPEEWGEAITWLIHTCEGLQHAHQMNLVHRDIKPANLLFDAEGHLAVTDFGLGKAIHKAEPIVEGSPLELMKATAEFSRQESSLTRTGVMSGTPHYAPPEQWMQKKVGPEADIYAFAIVAYEVLTGRHPYEPPGERWTLGQLISAHLMAQPPNPQSFHPDLPTQLSDTLVQCLGKKATDRPRTPAEIRDVLLAAYKERTGRDYAFGLPQPLSQRADSLNNKAVSLWSIGLREEAVQAWSEADRLERNHLEVTYNRMVTSWLTGRRTAQEAEEAIRELATVSVRGRAAAGLFMLTRGKFPEAVLLLEESLDSALLRDDGTLWRGLGEAYLAVGDLERARLAFEKALRLIPTDQFSKTSLEKLEAGDTRASEGLVSHSQWKARGKLSAWCLMEDSQSFVLLFGRNLVVADIFGAEKVCLEIPIASSTPVLHTKGLHIVVADRQQGWSMTLSRGEEWRLVGLKAWQQRVLGFVSDEALLVGDTTLQVRSLRDQSPQGPLLVGHEKQVLCFQISGDGERLITGGADRLVRLWSLRDGQCQVDGRGHQNFISALAVGSQEQLLVSGDRSGLVLLWLLPKMEKLHRFEFSGLVSRLYLRGEGRGQILFVEYDRDETEARTAVIFLDRFQVVFDRPGKFFFWGPGFGIWDADRYRLFGLPEGVEWRSQEVPGGPVCGAVYQDGENSIYLWTDEGDYNHYRLPDDLPEPPSLPLVRANTLSEVQHARQQFAESMEAAWASYRAEDWSEAYWQLSRARLVEGYSREPETLEFLSRLAKRLRRRELREMWRVRELTAPGHDRPKKVTIDYKGAWAATSSGNLIRLWDLRNGTCIRGLTGHRDEVVHLEFWEDGIGFGAAPLLLSFGADRTVRMWNPNSGACLQCLVASEHPIISVGVSQSSRRFALVTRGGQLLLGQWQSQEPLELSLLASCEYEGIPHHVSLSESGEFVVVCEEKSRAFAYSEGDQTLKRKGEFPHYIGLQLTRDRFVGAHPQGNVELIDIAKEKVLGPLQGEAKKVTCMTRTADGGVVAALDARATLRFWLVDSQQCVLERRLGVGLKWILFSGNGRYLAGLIERGSLLIWELEWQLDPSSPKVVVVEEIEVEAEGFWKKFFGFFGFGKKQSSTRHT